ncbi:MAG: TetR family transcriptional regulator [Alphaproteobacteria bacterium]|nr:TetR family transcriptional regulator [Alphaproteobacteria bacterium]
MARPVDRDAKRRQILEAAAARFAETGYDATSMEDLASAAGVSKGSLYDYFENKEDLFYGVFEWLAQTLMRASMERMREEATARARLAAFADASVSALIDHIDLYPVTLEVWAAAAKAGTRERFSIAMRSLYVAYRAEVTEIIAAAQRNGEVKKDVDADAVSALLVGAIDGLFLQYWLDPNFEARAWVKKFLGALFDGIATSKGEGQCA